jgi:transcriptional regulator with XRE-family HTH domain
MDKLLLVLNAYFCIWNKSELNFMETANVKKSNHGANIRRWREWRNINQDVLAEQIGVSQATLSGYEKRDKLEQEILDRIAKALDIPVEAITELEQGTAINIYSGTWQDNSSANGYVYSQTFNPIDKVVQLYDEKIALYERMLKEKDEAISLLQEVLRDKK